MHNIVEISKLSRNFQATKALDNISLELDTGKVYGLVGENGAGKSTLIKHIIGALQPQIGSVKVFGKSPAQYPVEVLSKIGYLSEERDLPMWMRAREFMDHTEAFFPDWDMGLACDLMQKFHIDPKLKIKNMSRGQKARTGLIAAVSHRPELLVLDEPSSGLDVMARYDILSEVVNTAASSRSTILFSSHLLDEVERVTDDIIMIHQGKIILTGHVDAIKSRNNRYLTALDSENEKVEEYLKTGKNIIRAVRKDGEWLLVTPLSHDAFAAEMKALGGTITEKLPCSLENVFIDHCSLENHHE